VLRYASYTKYDLLLSPDVQTTRINQGEDIRIQLHTDWRRHNDGRDLNVRSKGDSEMKTRTLLMTAVLLTVVTAVITGGSEKKIPSDEAIEVLAGS
jgi:hypothetical protein